MAAVTRVPKTYGSAPKCWLSTSHWRPVRNPAPNLENAREPLAARSQTISTSSASRPAATPADDPLKRRSPRRRRGLFATVDMPADQAFADGFTGVPASVIFASCCSDPCATEEGSGA